MERLDRELRGNMTTLQYITRKKKIFEDIYMRNMTPENRKFYLDLCNTERMIRGIR